MPGRVARAATVTLGLRAGPAGQAALAVGGASAKAVIPYQF